MPAARAERAQVVAAAAAGMEHPAVEHRADRVDRVLELAVDGWPWTVALPAVGFTSPSSIRSVVVLPAPLGPRKPTTRPSSAVNDRSSTASTGPKRLVSPATSIA